jgi:diguanylate cyclase (GGDEF)-like protein
MAQDARALPRVVVVDDDRFHRELVREAIAASACVEVCASAEEALGALARERAALVISDLEMPGLGGVELLSRVRREQPDTDVMLLTGHASVESAVAALRMGAADYLTKPVRPEQLALVVERILARRRLLAENERLRGALRVAESCGTLLRCLDPGEVYAVALDLLLHVLGCRRGLAVFRRTSLVQADGVAFRGFDEEQARALRRILVSEKPVDFDALGDGGLVAAGPAHDALRAVDLAPGRAFLVPLRGRESEAGALWAFEEGRPIGAAEAEHAQLVASHAAVALHNAERYHRAKERAFIDDVTEVYNARFLVQATDRELQRALRSGNELCVLFLDLDRFKLVNDQYGHLVGSQVLRRLSQVLLECIRQVDTLARYGGDEFTILLADTSVDDGMRIAERIRRSVADTLFESGGGSPIRLTLSVGVAGFPRDGSTRTELLDAADKAMYRAKSLGRNRVCAASELREGPASG